MIVLGLTGPSGAGKGMLSVSFARFGIPALDTDAIYHALLQPPSACLDELVDTFGRAILHDDGTLNRAVLAAIVFAKDAPAEYRNQLNDITHRFILDETRRQMEILRLQGVPAVLIDAPLLYESGFDAECDFVIAVIAPRDVRISRILARDDISYNAALARLAAQHDDDFYTAPADFVVCNDGSLEQLDGEAEKILRRLGVISG